MKKRYKETDVPALLSRLTERFEQACATYRLALATRDSNRAKKELSRENSRGTNIHKFQCNFAWLIHDIQKGPRCQIEDRVEDAEELISHINKISNT